MIKKLTILMLLLGSPFSASAESGADKPIDLATVMVPYEELYYVGPGHREFPLMAIDTAALPLCSGASPAAQEPCPEMKFTFYNHDKHEYQWLLVSHDVWPVPSVEAELVDKHVLVWQDLTSGTFVSSFLLAQTLDGPGRVTHQAATTLCETGADLALTPYNLWLRVNGRPEVQWFLPSYDEYKNLAPAGLVYILSTMKEFGPYDDVWVDGGGFSIFGPHKHTLAPDYGRLFTYYDVGIFDLEKFLLKSFHRVDRKGRAATKARCFGRVE